MFHADVVRSKLTRNTAATFKEVRKELLVAMDDLIPTSGDSTWRSLERNDCGSQGLQSGSRSLF
jgi:hypothetical protein